MPVQDYEDEEDDYADPEAPDEHDVDESEDEDTYPCPECGREVYDHADRCPHCDSNVSHRQLHRTGKPWWVYLVVALLMLAFFWWLIPLLLNFHP